MTDENRILVDPDDDIEVAPAAAFSDAAAAGDPQAVTVIDTLRNIQGEALLHLGLAGPAALGTLVLNRRTGTAALGAGLGKGHEALALEDLTLAATHGTGFALAVLGTAAGTAFTRLLVTVFDLFFGSEDRFEKLDVQLDGHIQVFPWTSAAATAWSRVCASTTSP